MTRDSGSPAGQGSRSGGGGAAGGGRGGAAGESGGESGGDSRRLGVRISGRVQGVGFRRWTEKQAGRLGVSGTVRNLPDGTVEVHARGPAARIREFRERLGDGPWMARVDGVREIPVELDADADGFRILF